MRKILLVFSCSLFTWAQNTSPAGTPVQMVITVGHHYGHEPTLLTRDDILATQRSEPLPVTSLVPLRDERAALELFLLVDHCSNCEFGSKLDELRKFIISQPATTTMGIAYIQDGRLQVVENPTADRERIVKALNAPAGSKPSTPYAALAELIKGWKEDTVRHAVLIISNGINPAVTDEPLDPSAEAAIDAAQCAGVTVYAIYHPSAAYEKESYSEGYSGQVHLAHVAYETGGEAYFVYVGPLPSLAPFLSDIGDHLANQYRVELLMKPEEGSGALQDVTIKAKTRDIELMAPGKVWVAGRPAVAQPKVPSRKR